MMILVDDDGILVSGTVDDGICRWDSSGGRKRPRWRMGSHVEVDGAMSRWIHGLVSKISCHRKSHTSERDREDALGALEAWRTGGMLGKPSSHGHSEDENTALKRCDVSDQDATNQPNAPSPYVITSPAGCGRRCPNFSGLDSCISQTVHHPLHLITKTSYYLQDNNPSALALLLTQSLVAVALGAACLLDRAGRFGRRIERVDLRRVLGKVETLLADLKHGLQHEWGLVRASLARGW